MQTIGSQNPNLELKIAIFCNRLVLIAMNLGDEHASRSSN